MVPITVVQFRPDDRMSTYLSYNRGTHQNFRIGGLHANEKLETFFFLRRIFFYTFIKQNVSFLANSGFLIDNDQGFI